MAISRFYAGAGQRRRDGRLDSVSSPTRSRAPAIAYERRLSRQREEAGLGRAAAAIAHEIRNPLNAMAMGLQRLQLEADELLPAHRRLLDIVFAAVGRTNSTVTGLLDYARPLHPRRERLALDALVSEQ
ncbi:histidine kinase dimerization/phospho-acceptor domain-containing protein [Chromatium okenii]|uniref:histidine kinase dimerization/phospho-acceptor domain-containing protein n=1 Tax=Chromatium okenii TaxID=61644 RepID=UPI001F5B93A7|nr:histidine kinase dimerization/phospho-acceptor domain-containing protein [Chromatium okenii]